MNRKKKLLIDASCIMAIIKQEPVAPEVISTASGYELFSADCLPFEIGNSLSKLLKRNLITVDEALKCFSLFSKLPITLMEVDFEAAIKLSEQEKHYAYDMYYLSCAVKNQIPLYTLDQSLISIAEKRGVVCL